MVERLPLHQPAAAQKVAPAAGVPVVEARVDAEPDHLIVVRVLQEGGCADASIAPPTPFGSQQGVSTEGKKKVREKV